MREDMQMRFVSAASLALEPQVVAHAAELFAVLSDPAIYEYENEPPSSLAWLRARFEKLESRQSPDGNEQWLNWVIRIPNGELIGYVQATVRAGGQAAIAYELASAYWGRGLASQAVGAMLGELAARYGVHDVSATLKSANHRSMRLLERLGFEPASQEEYGRRQVPPDECLMQLKIERS